MNLQICQAANKEDIQSIVLWIAAVAGRDAVCCQRRTMAGGLAWLVCMYELQLSNAGVRWKLFTCGCVLPAVLQPKQVATGGFFNSGVIAERAKIHPRAAVTLVRFYAVEAFAGSVAVAVA